jgi:hypothetical protein
MGATKLNLKQIQNIATREVVVEAQIPRLILNAASPYAPPHVFHATQITGPAYRRRFPLSSRPPDEFSCPSLIFLHTSASLLILRLIFSPASRQG